MAGNRSLNSALNLFIALTAGVILYVFLVGGIEIQLGGVVPGIARAKLTCNKLLNPSLFLLLLLFFKALVIRPAPLARLRHWCERNGRTILLGLLVTLAASIPRLWNLDGHSLAPDELAWASDGQKLIFNLRVREFKKATAHLYYPGVVPAALIGASYLYLGKDTSPLSYGLLAPIVSARLPIALLGIITCLAIYLLGRIAFGDAASFWAAVFLGLLPEHISLSRVAHVDCALTFSFTLSLLCYLVYAQRLRLKWKVISAVFFGCALLTKTPAVLIPFILLIWKACVCFYDRRGKFRFWEASDLGWLGLGLVIYFSLYTRLWYESRELGWIEFLHCLPQAAVAIRIINGISRFPWVEGAGALLFAYLVVRGARKIRGGGAASAPGTAHPMLRGIFLTFICCAFIQVFRKPMVNELLYIARSYHFGDVGHLKYWMGTVVLRPPGWFYLFMLLIRTPPVMLFLLICGIVRACSALWKRESGWSAHFLSFLASLIFIIAMSLTHKMAIRYIAPAFPFICLLSAVGLMGIIDARAVRRLLGQVPLHALAGILIACACVIPLNNVAPYYDIYCNFLIGGPAGASRLVSIGYGVGTKEAVEYLKPRVKGEDSIAAVGISGEFRYYWEHEKPLPACAVLIDRAKPPHVDWLVIPLGHRMRLLAERELRLVEGLSKIHSVTMCGVDFIDIYKTEDKPVSENRSYEAGELKTGLGKEVIDGDARHGTALEGSVRGRSGMLIAGPCERYSPGCWRAVFRLKSGSAMGDAPVARLAVTGISTEDIVKSVNLTRGQFRERGVYQEFSVDFCIARPRRLQFCVSSMGTTDLLVDGVTVERREVIPRASCMIRSAPHPRAGGMKKT
jgi:4-amino-4-deoxy-L-arabinose transferase-like glycosyltransferase